MNKPVKSNLYARIRAILDSARTTVARSVNTTQVIANWLVGREIVEEEQRGKLKAEYGERILKDLAALLSKEFGVGYSGTNLRWFRQFYLEYPNLFFQQIYHAPRDKSCKEGHSFATKEIHHAPSDTTKAEITGKKQHAARVISDDIKEIVMHYSAILHAPRGISDALPRKSDDTLLRMNETWKPGLFNPNLSWTHYRTLLKVKRIEARSFYEIESVKNGWSARQLERQINSLLFERLFKSRDKKGVLALAQKGLVVSKPIDIMKDPVILEFLDLPESNRLVETDVEAALLSKLKDFLLELGNGFAYIGRQKRLSLEGDHFYPDLVFYHIKLKCYVIIDLKVQKLTHGDLGQMLMYVHYYDREIKTKDENPTIGLILCTDKNDAVVKYVLDDKERQIFTSRYKYELPTEEDLRQELRREMNQLSLPVSAKPIRKPSRRSK